MEAKTRITDSMIEQLRQLSLEAGIANENIWVDKEPLGVNLFLHITKTHE